MTVLPINDTSPEGVETITMNITPSSGSYGVRQGSATMLLGDNDNFTSGSVGFAATTATTTESIGTYNLAVNLTGTPPSAVSVQYRVNGGTAAGNGIDFTLAEGTLTFPSSPASQMIPIVIRQDILPEPAETIVVQLLNQTGANLGTNSHTLTVNNISVPEAFTDPITAATATGATFNGRVMPGGLATSYWFEYGLTTDYGQVTATQNIAAGSALTAVSAVFSGNRLTTYHYRLVVQNAQGITSGINQSFTTSSAINFATAASVPIVSNEFFASVAPTVTLGFIPVAGQILEMVDNTGFQPVTGTFTGMPEGSLITATNGATPYRFEISYRGGDGNDIVLTAVDEVITFSEIGVKYVGDPDFALAATTSGTSAVTYEIVAGSPSATVSGSTVTLTATPGTVTIKATAGTALPKYQTFVLAVTGTGFVQVSASKQAQWSLGITANGLLFGWGDNTYGNLGDASTTQRRSPTQAGTATNWRQVSAGIDHAVGTRTNGTLWAWGRNNNGQIGQGSTTTTQYTSPTQIGTAADWAWVVAGANHCVAVKTTGTIWSWGTNASGQLGNGTTSATPTTTPTQIGTLTTWGQTGAHLHAGSDFTLAIRTNGTLWAWGVNSSGQIGDASTTNRTSPLQIGSVTTWSRVIAGASFSGALSSDGSFWTWGSNSSGQLGDGTLTNRTAPAQLGADADWSRLAAGTAFFLATKTNGSLWSWGNNNFGQLGQGSADLISGGKTPLQVGTATNWQEISGGQNFSLAITTDGGLRAWGSSASNQLGWLPRAPLPLYPQMGPVMALSGGTGNSTALLRMNGSLWTLGSNSSGQLGLGAADSGHHPIPTEIALGQTWRVISAAQSYVMAIRTDGSLWAVGSNGSGQLGDGTVINRASLTRIGTETDWVAVSANSFTTGSAAHTLAIKANGSLWAWGSNASGQLGDGSTTSSLTPLRVGTDSDWRMVFSTGGSHSLAIKNNGTLWVWGSNSNGQVGNSTTVNASSPLQILTGVRTASGGTVHTLAIKTDGTLWAWGLNSSGQLGDGSTTQRTAPVQVGSAIDWSSVSCPNGTATHATRSDGTLWTWGIGNLGQFGNGAFSSSNRTSPVQVGNASVWRSVNSIGGHALARTMDGTAWGWGFSNAGPTAFAGHDQWNPDQVFPALTPPQTITFTAPSTVTVGTSITLNATASSGLPARYIITGPATLNGDKLTVTGGGFVSVIAYQPGDFYWQSSDIKHAYINLNAPTATTSAVTNVTTTSATLNASVNPSGAPTTAQFQSGTTVSYGTNTPVTLLNPGGLSAENVTLALSGLTQGTTYHYRINASNLGGSANGLNFTFTTLSNNANLSDLTLNAGTLSPIFGSAQLNYVASVPVTTTAVNLTALRAQSNATLRLRNNAAAFAPISSGVASAVTLVTGLNNVQIEVTAQDGVTQRLYSIQITRAASFAQWSSSTGISGSTSTGPLDDFDADGLANVIEYAFGMSGTSSSGMGDLVLNGSVLSATGQPISLSLPPQGGGPPQWCAIFIRRKDYVQAGLTYTPNFSANLGTWQASTDTPTVLADDGIYQALCLPYPVIGGQPAKFFSVEISIAP